MLGVARHAHHVVKALMAAAPDLPAAIVAQIWQSLNSELGASKTDVWHWNMVQRYLVA